VILIRDAKELSRVCRFYGNHVTARRESMAIPR
jgi:hypothetical protein